MESNLTTDTLHLKFESESEIVYIFKLTNFQKKKSIVREQNKDSESFSRYLSELLSHSVDFFLRYSKI